MDKSISPGLRTTFLIHAIVALLLGLPYLLVPDMVGSVVNWDMSDVSYRIVGAALTAIGISSWLSYQASTWGEVRIVVQFEIVWAALVSVVTAWALFFGLVPAVTWLNLGIAVVFAILFGFFYARDK
jgi:hypothetical protein